MVILNHYPTKPLGKLSEGRLPGTIPRPTPSASANARDWHQVTLYKPTGKSNVRTRLRATARRIQLLKNMNDFKIKNSLLTGRRQPLV